MSDTFGHLRTYRITLNELFGSTDDDGGSTRLMIRNDGNDTTGSVVIRAAGNKISTHQVNANGAKIHMDGEVELGSYNHAAQIFSNSSVSTDMHIRTTNATSGIFLDPATKRVTVNGNVALNGGTLLSDEQDLTLYSSGTGKRDIILDPRAHNDGGDVLMKGNLLLEQQQIEGRHGSNLTINGKKDLVLTSDEGNVQMLLGSCSVNALDTGALQLQGSTLSATSTGNAELRSTSSDTSIYAGDMVEADGDGVSVVGRNLTKGVVLNSGAGNVRLLRGNASMAGANVQVQARNGDMLVSGSNRTHVLASGAGGVAVQAQNANVSLTAAHNIVMQATGNVLSSSHDTTLQAGNLAKVSSTVYELSSTTATLAATSVMQVQSETISMTGTQLVSSAVGNATTSASNVRVSAGSNAANLNLLKSGEASLVSVNTANITSTSGSVVARSGTAIAATAGTDATVHAANVATLKSDQLAQLTGADSRVEASVGNVAIVSSKLLSLDGGSGVSLTSSMANLDVSVKNVALSAHDALQQETVGLTLTSAGDAIMAADRSIQLNPTGSLGVTSGGNVSVVSAVDSTLQAPNVAAVRSSQLALVKSTNDARVEASDVTLDASSSINMEVSSGTFSVNSRSLQLDVYDGASSVATLELENTGDINLAGEGDLTMASVSGNIVSTAGVIDAQAGSKLSLGSNDKVDVSAVGNIDLTSADVNLVASGVARTVATGNARVESLSGYAQVVGTNALLTSSAGTTVDSTAAVLVEAKGGDVRLLASQDLDLDGTRDVLLTAGANAKTAAADVYLQSSGASVHLGDAANLWSEAGMHLTANVGDASVDAGNVVMQAREDASLRAANAAVVHSDARTYVTSTLGTHVQSAANVDVAASHVNVSPSGNFLVATQLGDIKAATGSSVRLRANVADVNAAESATPTVMGLTADGNVDIQATRDVLLTAHTGDVLVGSTAGDSTLHASNVAALSSDDQVRVVASTAAVVEGASVSLQATGDVSVGGSGVQLSSTGDAGVQAQTALALGSAASSVTVSGAKDAFVQGGSNVQVDATSVLLATGAGVHIAATTDSLTPSDSMAGRASLELSASTGDTKLSGARDVYVSALDATMSGSNAAVVSSANYAVLRSDKETLVDATGGNVRLTASSDVQVVPTVNAVTTATGGNVLTSARNVHMDALSTSGVSMANLRLQRSGRATMQANKILMHVSDPGGNIHMTVPSGNIETSAQFTKIESGELHLKSTQHDVAIEATAANVEVQGTEIATTSSSFTNLTSGDDMNLTVLNNKDINLNAFDINLMSANLITFQTNGGGIDMGANAAIDSEHLDFRIEYEFTSITGEDTTFQVGANLVSNVSGDVVTTAVGNVGITAGTAELLMHRSGDVTLDTADLTAHASNAVSISSDGVLALTSSDTVTVKPAKNLKLLATTGDVTQMASAGNALTQAKSVSVKAVSGGGTKAELLLPADGHATLSSSGNVNLLAATGSWLGVAQGTANLSSTAGATVVSGFTEATLRSDGAVKVQSGSGTEIGSSSNVEITATGDLVLQPTGNIVTSSSSLKMTSSGTANLVASALDVQTTGAVGVTATAFDVQTTGNADVTAAGMTIQTTGDVGVTAAALGIQTTGNTDVSAAAMTVQTTGDVGVTAAALGIQTTGNTDVSAAAMTVQTTGDLSVDADGSVGVTTAGAANLHASALELKSTSGGKVSLGQAGAASLATNGASVQLTQAGAVTLASTTDLGMSVGGDLTQSAVDSTLLCSNAARIQAADVRLQATQVFDVLANILDVEATTADVLVNGAATVNADTFDLTTAAGAQMQATGDLLLVGNSAMVRAHGNVAKVETAASGDAVVTASRNFTVDAVANVDVTSARTNLQSTSDTLIYAGGTAGMLSVGDVSSHSKSANAHTTATNVVLSALQIDSLTGETTTLETSHASLQLLDTGIAAVEAASDILLTPTGDLVATATTGNVETTARNTTLVSSEALHLQSTAGTTLVSSGASAVSGSVATMTATTGDARLQSDSANVVLATQNEVANVRLTAAGAVVARAAQDVQLLANGDTVLTGTNLVSTSSADATVSAANVARLHSTGACRVEAGGDTTLVSQDLLVTPTRDVKITPGRHHVVTATGNATTTAANAVLASSSSPGTKLQLLATGAAALQSANDMSITSAGGDVDCGAQSVRLAASTDSTIAAANVAAVRSDGTIALASVGATAVGASEISMVATGAMSTQGASVTLQSTATNGSTMALPSSGGATLTAPGGNVHLLPAGDLVARSTGGGNVTAEGASVTVKSSATGGSTLLLTSTGASVSAPAGDITVQPTVGKINLLTPGASGDLVVTSGRDATVGASNLTTVQSATKVAIDAPTSVVSAANATVTATKNLLLTGSEEAALESSTLAVVRSTGEAQMTATANVSITAGGKTEVTPTGDFVASSASGDVKLLSQTGNARMAGASNVAVLQLEANGRSALSAGAGGMALRLPAAGDFSTTVSAGNAHIQALDATMHASNACVLKSDAVVRLDGATLDMLSSGNTRIQPTGDLVFESSNVVSTSKLVTLLAKEDGETDSSLVLQSAGDSVLRASRNVQILPSGDLLANASNVSISAFDATVSASNASVLRSDGTCLLQSAGGNTTVVSSADLVANTTQDVLLNPGRHLLVTATGNANTVGANANMSSSVATGTKLDLLSTGDAHVQADRHLSVQAATNVSLTATAGNLQTSSVDATVSASNASVLRADGTVSIESLGATQMTAATSMGLTANSVTMEASQGDFLVHALGAGNVRTKGKSVVLESTQNATKFNLYHDGNTLLNAPGATTTFTMQDHQVTATGNATTVAANVELNVGSAKLLMSGGHMNLESDSGVLVKPTAGDIALRANAGNVDVDCQILDVQSTTSTIASTNTTLTSSDTVRLQAAQSLLMTGSATANLHSTSVTTVRSDNKVDIRAGTEIYAAAPRANINVDNDVLVQAANLSLSGTQYVTNFTGGHTSSCLDFTQNVARQANLVSQYKGFSFEALDGNNGNFDVKTANRINLETQDLNLLASNVAWGVASIVATHADGFKIENTNGHMELKSANDVILGPSANLQIQSDNINISSVGAATFASTSSDLNFSADTHINLNPATATRTGMPLEFLSGANTHIKATNGPLRLTGGDSNNTVRVEGNFEVAGTVNYITTNASSIQIEDKQIVLGMSDVSDDNAANNAGIVVNGSQYESDAESLSLLWKKTDAAQSTTNDPAPFWRLSGGDMSISRVIPQAAWESPFHADETAGYQSTSQLVEYRWCITHDEKLQLIKLRGRKQLGVNMATDGSDKQVIAEFDM